MKDTITRTFNLYKVTINDAKSGEVLVSEMKSKKITPEKALVDFIKQTGKQGAIADVQQITEKREMPLQVFYDNSTPVADDADEEAPKEEAKKPTKKK